MAAPVPVVLGHGRFFLIVQCGDVVLNPGPGKHAVEQILTCSTKHLGPSVDLKGVAGPSGLCNRDSLNNIEFWEGDSSSGEGGYYISELIFVHVFIICVYN